MLFTTSRISNFNTSQMARQRSTSQISSQSRYSQVSRSGAPAANSRAPLVNVQMHGNIHGVDSLTDQGLGGPIGGQFVESNDMLFSDRAMPQGSAQQDQHRRFASSSRSPNRYNEFKEQKQMKLSNYNSGRQAVRSSLQRSQSSNVLQEFNKGKSRALNRVGAPRMAMAAGDPTPVPAQTTTFKVQQNYPTESTLQLQEDYFDKQFSEDYKEEQMKANADEQVHGFSRLLSAANSTLLRNPALIAASLLVLPKFCQMIGADPIDVGVDAAEWAVSIWASNALCDKWQSEKQSS